MFWGHKERYQGLESDSNRAHKERYQGLESDSNKQESEVVVSF